MELSSTQAAQIMSTTVVTVIAYIDRGLLPARRMGVRRIVRIKPHDLRVFAETYGFAWDEEKFQRFTGGSE